MNESKCACGRPNMLGKGPKCSACMLDDYMMACAAKKEYCFDCGATFTEPRPHLLGEHNPLFCPICHPSARDNPHSLRITKDRTHAES